MSSIVISGDSSGAITLAAPSVAGTNTITLPASTGTVLTTGSPQSGGVIQAVTYSKINSSSTTSTSYVATNLTLSITPKFSTSKILILFSFTWANAGTANSSYCTIYRNSTELSAGLSGSGFGQTYNQAGNPTYFPTGISYVDSPATTSSTTYTLYIKANAGQTIYIGDNNTIQSITLMEIAA